MYLFQPLIVVVNGFGMIFSLISLFTTFAQVQVTIQSIGYGIVVFILLYLSIVFVILEGKFTRHIAKYIFSLPVYNLTWVPIIIQGFIDRNNTEWNHTLHVRALSISDIERVHK